MLSTTQTVVIAESAFAARIAQALDLPTHLVEGRVVGPAIGSVDLYVVAYRPAGSEMFESYVVAGIVDDLESRYDDSGRYAPVVEFVGDADYTDALIEAFIPDHLWDDFA